MHIKEIQEFSEIRVKARAYLCYIMGRNISQTIQNGDISYVLKKLKTFKQTIPKAEVVYALDSNGVQITENISDHKLLEGLGKGQNRSERAYYYRTVQNHSCTLTDPYPSQITNRMVVTSAFPIYDEADNLLCIICVDITLPNILKMVHPSSIDSVTGTLSKIAYTSFSVALAAVALLLFIKGITSFLHFGLDFSAIDINQIFQSTILLTLSLAIFDLVKAIFEEEVLGKAEILKSFPFDKKRVCGGRVLEGRLAIHDFVKLKRGEDVLGEGRIISLRRGRDEVNKVEPAEELGAIIEPQFDFESGDVIVSFHKLPSR